MDLAGPQLRLKPISPLSARLGFLRPHSFFPPPLPPLSLPHPAQPLPLGTGVGDQPTGPGPREGAGSGQGRILIEAKEVASSRGCLEVVAIHNSHTPGPPCCPVPIVFCLAPQVPRINPWPSALCSSPSAPPPPLSTATAQEPTNFQDFVLTVPSAWNGFLHS